MKNMEIKYWVSLILSLICVFMIIDTIMAFSHDLYAIFLGQYVNIPLGIASVVISLVIQVKESDKTKWKKCITVTGIVLGFITSVVSIVLFKIGMIIFS